MKIFVALFAVVAVVSADWSVKSGEELIQSRLDCIKELNVPANYIDQIKKFEYADEEIVRCYIKCTSEKIGIWSDETGFDAERAADQLAGSRDKVALKADILKCIDNNEQKTDKCTWAYRNFKCFLANNLILVKSQVNA